MKKNMRLFLVVMVVLALMLTIVACKDKTPDTTTAGKTTTAEPITTKDPSTTADPTTTAPTTTTGAPTTDPVTSEPTVTTTAPTTDAPVVPEFPYTASGEWTVENGVYTSTKGAAMIAVGTAGKTGTFEVKMTALKGSDINDNGIFFGLTDKDGDKKYWAEGADIQYYWLFVSDAGTLALARLDGSWAAQGWVEIPGYTHGDEVTIKAIVANDGKIYCYANDQLLYTFTESAPYEGVVYGFRAEVAGVVFKDLKVTADATPIIPPKDPEDTSIEGAAGKWEVKDGVYTAMAGNSIIYLGTADDIFAGYTFEFCMNKGANGGDSGFLFGINDLQGDGKYWEGDVHYLFYGTANNGVDINAFWINPGWGNWQGLHYKPTGYANDKDVRIKFTPSLSADGSKILVTAWFTYDMTSENPEWTLLYENKAMDTATAANLGNGYGLRAGKTGNKFWNIKITEPEKPEPVKGANGEWWVKSTAYVSAAPNSIMVLGKDFTTGVIAANMFIASDLAVESYNGLIFGASDVDSIFWEGKGTSYYFLSTDKDGNLVLSKIVDGTTTVLGTAPIANYVTGRTIQLKATVSPDGSIKAYADGALLITVMDKEPLKGTMYGVRAGDEGVSFDADIVKTIITDTVADNFNIVYGDVASDFESLVSLTENTIIFSNDKADSVLGRYTFKYTDVNGGQNGVIAAYSQSAQGASYYYVYVMDGALYVYKVVNGTFNTLGVVVVNGLTEEGTHSVILEIAAIEDGAIEIIPYVDGAKCDSVEDATPLTGDTYGAILSKDSSLETVSYFYSVPAESVGYIVEHNPDNSMFFDGDGIVHGGANTIALKIDNETTSSAGQYVLKFNNTNAGDNGLVLAYSRTGENTWEGRGTSYYFVFLTDKGVHIGKTTNGTWKGCATFEYAKSPLLDKHIPTGVSKGGYTRAGEHELVVNYSGNGIEGSNATFWVYLDGLYLGSWADTAPLFGTGYGVRSGAAGTEFTELRRDSLRIETYWYNPDGSRDVTYVNENGTATLGNGSMVLASNPAKTTAGRYTLNFTDNGAGDNGIVFAHSRTGSSNWEKNGVSYYFVYVTNNSTNRGPGARIARCDDAGYKEVLTMQTTHSSGATPTEANRGAFAEKGTHTLTVDYDGKGMIMVYIDGMYFGSYYDANPLTGTDYGMRVGANTQTLNSLSYEEVDYGVEKHTMVNDKTLITEYKDGTFAYTKAINNECGGAQLVKVGNATSNDGTGIYETEFVVPWNNCPCSGFYFAGGENLSSTNGLTYNNANGDLNYYEVFINESRNIGFYKNNTTWGNSSLITKALPADFKFGDNVYLKVDYDIVDNVGIIMIYYKLTEEADWTPFIYYVDAAPLTGTAYGVHTRVRSFRVEDLTYEAHTAEYNYSHDDHKLINNSGAANLKENNPRGDGPYTVVDGVYTAVYGWTAAQIGSTGEGNGVAGFTYEWTIQKPQGSTDMGLIIGLNDTDNDGHIWEVGSNANYVWLASALNDEKFKICPSQNNWGGWVKNGSGAISALNAPVRFKATATDVDGMLYIEAWYTTDVESDNPTWTPITYTVDGVVVSGSQSTGKATSIFGNGIGFRAGHTHSGAQIWDIVAYETADPTNVVFNSNGTNLQ